MNVRPHAVDLREVGMRDGLQLEEPIPLQKKLVMLDALIATGVRRIEVSSFVSPKAVPALADAAELVSALPADQTVEFTALVAGYGGARRALAAGITSLEYVVSCSDGHSMANARRTSDEAIRAIDDIASLVHASGGLLEVIFAVAWDCPFDGRTPVRRVADAARRAVDLGADRLCLGDTLGTVVPGRARELLDAVREAAPGPQIGVHFHNTRRGPRVRTRRRTSRRNPDRHLGGRPWRLSLRARRQRQHRDRGGRVHARGVRDPHRTRPRRSACRRRCRRTVDRARATEQALPATLRGSITGSGLDRLPGWDHR